jgi:hypothetical protein
MDPAQITALDLRLTVLDSSLQAVLPFLPPEDVARLFGPRLGPAHLRAPGTIRPAHLQGLTQDQARAAARYLRPVDLQRLCGTGVNLLQLSASGFNPLSLSAFNGLSQGQALALLSFLDDTEVRSLFGNVTRDMLLDPSLIAAASLAGWPADRKQALLSFLGNADAMRLLPGTLRQPAPQVAGRLAPALNAPEKLDGHALSQQERDAFVAAWPGNSPLFPPGITQAKLESPGTIGLRDFAGCTPDQAWAALSFLSDPQVASLFGAAVTREKLQSPVTLKKAEVLAASADQAMALRSFICQADIERFFSRGGTPLAKAQFSDLSSAELRAAITLLSDAQAQAVFAMSRRELLAVPPSALKVAAFADDIAQDPSTYLPGSEAGWAALIDELASPPAGSAVSMPLRARIVRALLQSDGEGFAARLVGALPEASRLELLDAFFGLDDPAAAALLARLFAAMPATDAQALLSSAKTRFKDQGGRLALLPGSAHPELKPPLEAPALSAVQAYSNDKVQILQDGSMQLTGLGTTSTQCAAKASALLDWDEPQGEPKGDGRQQLVNRVANACISALFGGRTLTAANVTDLMTRANDAGKTDRQKAQRRFLRVLVYNQYTAATGRPSYPRMSPEGAVAEATLSQLISAPNPFSAIVYGVLASRGQTQSVVQVPFPPIPAYEDAVKDEFDSAFSDPGIQEMYERALDQRVEYMVTDLYGSHAGAGTGVFHSDGLEFAHAWLNQALQDFAAKAPPATPPLALGEITERLGFIHMLASFNKRYPAMEKTSATSVDADRQRQIADDADKALQFVEEQRASMAAAVTTVGLLPAIAPTNQSIKSTGIPLLASILRMTGASRHFLNVATDLDAWLGTPPSSYKTGLFAELMKEFFPDQGVPEDYAFGNFDGILRKINQKYSPPPFGENTALVKGLRTLNKMGMLGTLSGLASLSSFIQTAVDVASKGRTPTAAEQAKIAANIFALLSVPNHYAKLFAPDWAAINHISDNPMGTRPVRNPTALAVEFVRQAGWNYTLTGSERSLSTAQLAAQLDMPGISAEDELLWTRAIFERARQNPADADLADLSLRAISKVRAREHLPPWSSWPNVEGAPPPAASAGSSSRPLMPAAWRNMKPAFAFGMLTGAMDLAAGVACIVQASLTLADEQGRASLPSTALANISIASGVTTLLGGLFGATLGAMEIAAMFSTVASSVMKAIGPVGWAASAVLTLAQFALQFVQMSAVMDAISDTASSAQALFAQVCASMVQDRLTPPVSISYGSGSTTTYTFSLPSDVDASSAVFSVSNGSVVLSYRTSGGIDRKVSIPTKDAGDMVFVLRQGGLPLSASRYDAGTGQVGPTAIPAPAPPPPSPAPTPYVAPPPAGYWNPGAPVPQLPPPAPQVDPADVHNTQLQGTFSVVSASRLPGGQRGIRVELSNGTHRDYAIYNNRSPSQFVIYINGSLSATIVYDPASNGDPTLTRP